MPKLLNVQEVAEILRIHRATVWRLAQRGDIPQPLRFGKSGVRRWTEPQIDRYLAECEASGQPAREVTQ